MYRRIVCGWGSAAEAGSLEGAGLTAPTASLLSIPQCQAVVSVAGSGCDA